MQGSFEEQQGRIARRIQRLWRAVRWWAKSLLRRPRSILVELNWRLGDEIMALPVLDALRARYPDVELTLLTNYPDIFESYPAVQRINPPRANPDRYLLLRGASRRENRLDAYCARAGLPVPCARPRLAYSEWCTPLCRTITPGEGPLIALAPGASWPSKRWPNERWNTLARTLLDQGCRVIVLGNQDEALAHGQHFTGQTTVREAACLLHAADLAVCCDSGLMHLALAAGTPVIALFGPTDPDCLVRDEPLLTPLRSTQSCQGFWNHAEHVGAPGLCPEGHECCLESITMTQVLDAVRARMPHGERD